MRYRQLRNRYLLAIDAVALPLAALVAFAVRFEGAPWPAGAGRVLAVYVALSLPLKLAAMWWLGLYSRLWRYASVADLRYLLAAAAAAAAGGALVGFLGIAALPLAFERVPIAAQVLDALLTALAIAAPRLLARTGLQLRPSPRHERVRRVLVVGAGAAGAMIVRELLENAQLGLHPTALVDDDPSKHGRRLHGVPIVGPTARLEDLLAHDTADEVVIAMPSAPGRVVRDVVRVATAAGVPTRTVPGLYELIDGRKAVGALRAVNIEDLLRREPVRSDLELVRSLAADHVVMVTGAGGSIGGELCRQLARLRPALLVAVGRGENSIFELLQELAAVAPELRVQPVIADVRDRGRMAEVFARYRPHTVFHAAAHKHVPLMEQNVAEAVLNNVLGTRVVAELAVETGAQRFVLISSDKAVRPSSVMGATKRIAEGIVQECARRSGRTFVSVRFGNVLGSRGSVIPTFLRQIRAGGPVTITHPEMRRYFMTIPEAVQLVLQAGAMGVGGEVFVLDMGEAVRVVDLARDLIRLSGLEVEHDVELRFTGMRPGEKLYEELFFSAENALPTAHPKVLRARNATLPLTGATSVHDLVAAALGAAPATTLRAMLRAIVPEYTGGDGEPEGAAHREAPARVEDDGPHDDGATAEPDVVVPRGERRSGRAAVATNGARGAARPGTSHVGA